MMRRYAEEYTDIHNLISNLTDRSIKSIISKSHRVSSDGSVSDLGYYMHSTRRGKRMRGSGAQSRMFKAFMITDPGQLPPQSNQPWYQCVITAAPDSSWFPAAVREATNVPIDTDVPIATDVATTTDVPIATDATDIVTDATAIVTDATDIVTNATDVLEGTASTIPVECTDYFLSSEARKDYCCSWTQWT